MAVGSLRLVPLPQTAIFSPPEIQQGVKYAQDTLVTGYDLTGVVIKCQLRRAIDSPDVVLDWSRVRTPVAVNTSGTPHRIEWRLDDDEAAKLPAGTYVYDVEAHRAGRCEKRLQSGTWPITGEVTRE